MIGGEIFAALRSGDVNFFGVRTSVSLMVTIKRGKVSRLQFFMPLRVRVLDGATVLADHPRSFDRKAQIEDAAHIDTLVEHKRRGRHHRGIDHLAKAAPACRELLIRAAERGANLGTVTAALLRLLDRYGAAELQAATVEVLAGVVPHPNAVRLALERRREARNGAPPVATCLPQHVKQKDAPVQPHRLDTYDTLTGEHDE